MGKHRKNHKQKVAAFKQKQVQKKKQIEKLQELFKQQIAQYEQTSKVEFMLETLMRNKPELVTKVGDELVVNLENVEVKDDKLVWKADGTSVFSNFVHEDEHYIFTLEHTNKLLASINEKIRLRLMDEANKAYEAAVANGTVDTFFQTHFNKEGDLQEVQAEEVVAEEVTVDLKLNENE
jgi:oligoendopeptidase F